MTLFSSGEACVSFDTTSGLLNVGEEGRRAFTTLPTELSKRSAVFESLQTTTGTARLPYPLSNLEVWAQFVSGLGPVDWLVSSMKAAHFLRDQATCSRAAEDLAEVVDGISDWHSKSATALQSKLDSLEPDLLILIFQHSKVPLHVTLSRCPSCFHQPALRSHVKTGGCLRLQQQLRTSILPVLGLHLSTLSYISHLDLSKNYLGRTASDLSLILCPLQALTFLSLAATALGDSGVSTISPHLQNLRRLRHLSLADASLSAAAAKPLLRALSPLSCLEHLDLSGNAFDIAGNVALTPLLATLTALTFLDNIGARFSARALAPPTICPPTLSALQQLGLQVHSTAASDIASVSLPLARFTALTSLRLHFEHSSQHPLALSLSPLLHLRALTLSSSSHGTLSSPSLLSPLTSLTLLNLSCFRIPDRGAFLSSLCSLESLRLHQAFVEPDDTPPLAPFLPALTALSALALESNVALAAHFHPLGHALTRLTTLLSLCFRDNHECSENPALELFGQLTALSRLEELDLDNSWLPDADAAALAASLRALPRLQHLNISTNPLWDVGARALVSVLPSLPLLTFLNLSDTCVKSLEAAMLLSALSCLTALDYLDISNLCDGRDHRAGPAAAFELATALPALVALRTLNVVANDFGHGFAALAPALAAPPMLSRLHLGEQTLPEDAAVALGPALAALPALQYLDLSGMGASVVAAFSPPGNVYFPALTELYLCDCDVGDLGVAQLTPCIARMASLVRLGLARNRLTEAGVRVLARHIVRLSELRTLLLGSNDISSRGYVQRARDSALAGMAVF